MSTLTKIIIAVLFIIVFVWSGFLVYSVFLKAPEDINNNKNINVNNNVNLNNNSNTKVNKNINLNTNADDEKEVNSNINNNANSNVNGNTNANDDTNTNESIEDPVTLKEGELKVYFLDQEAFDSGKQPYEKYVVREKEDIDEADEVFILKQLYWGETDQGLASVLSGTTGFRSIQSKDGISHIVLVGACSSGGSTYTIADLILKNLKQLEHIDYVKIYDENEETQDPEGKSDSIPECLEP